MDKAPRVLLARSLIGGAIWALGGFMPSYFFFGFRYHKWLKKLLRPRMRLALRTN